MAHDTYWQSPPEDPHLYRPDWQAVADTLRANPGRWMKVFEGERASLATAVAIGHITCLRRQDGFIMRTANNTRTYPRTCDLYMQYNPPKEGN